MTTFQLGSIEVGKLQKASVVLSGRNFRKHQVSYQKINDGFGNLKGEKTVACNNQTVLVDKDLLDMFGR